MEAEIRLVRPEFLVELHEKKKLLPRRQEAEDLPGAFFVPTLHEQFQVISISHCWEAKEHPDPYGFQLQKMVQEIKALKGSRMLQARQGLNEALQYFIFYDYLSLPQFQRETSHQEMCLDHQSVY